MPLGSNILIYSNNATTREWLIRLLMYQRFVPKAVDNINYANLALLSGEFPIFLCYYSPEDTEILEFLKKIREDVQLRSIVPVILLEKPTKEILQTLILNGCSNFISQEAGQQALLNKLDSIAETLGDLRDKRQYVRLEIPDYETAQVLITARNGNKYPIRISNLSLGGVQLAWTPEKIPVQKMVVGDVLMNCLLIIKSLDLYTDLRIISVYNYRASTQFIGLNEESQAALCNFIYERLLSEKIDK